MARPKKGAGEHYRTPIRSVRVPDDIWEAAKAEAAERGETVSDVILRALERYGRQKR